MTSMILLGVVTLLKYPHYLQLLKNDPKKWNPLFVGELCRFYTASELATKRVAKVDVVIGRKSIKAGEGIIAATQARNRDKDVFPNPNVFDIRRTRGKEKALGFG